MRVLLAALCALPLATPALAVDPPLTCARVATGLSRPLLVQHAPGDFSRAFIVEQSGTIKILNLPANTLNPTPFLDITPQVPNIGLEYGLLGLVFDPGFASNGYFYISYAPQVGTLYDYAVVRYQVSAANPNVANAASAQTILRVTYTRNNHRASWMEFGSDGYLYLTTGDGGEGDPDNAASNTSPVTPSNQLGLRGKVLRIDVHGDDDFPSDANRNYHVPATNPFATDPTKAGEIWAYGLRNPWRASFDTATGDLYIGDVGQATREEVDVIQPQWTAPHFMGWRCREGAVATGYAGCPGTLPASISPMVDYPRTATTPGFPYGGSVTGGHVYRGCAIPGLEGTYFFADWITGKMWTFRYDRAANTRSAIVERTTELAVAGSTPAANITSFGTDAFGEIYWTRGSEVWKLVPRTLQGADCNANSRTDACEILASPALDTNHDGVLDACQPCGHADVGHQGGVPGFDRILDNNDFVVFIDYFFNGNPIADLGSTGGVPGADTIFDNNDFVVFIDDFFTGCP
jgi:glucose/arabinose dehydrogenase